MKQTRTFLTLSLLACSLLTSLTGFCQASRRPDQIVRYDNTVIDALISEIDETSVSYRKTTAPQGTLYRVKKSEISYVRYTNGEVERFDGKGAKAVAVRPTSAAVASRPQTPAARKAPAASSADPKTRFGLTVGGGAGLFMSSASNSDMGMALRGGLTAEIPLGSSIALAPSVEFLRFSQTEGRATTALNYGVATLAIVPLYKDGKGVNFFYSIGAYGAYGLNVTAEGESASFKEVNLSTFHAGADLKLGARFSQALTIYAQGDYGLTTMVGADAPKGVPTITQTTFGAGLRYFFGK